MSIPSEVPNSLMRELEEGCSEGIKALRAFLKYEGNNPSYEKKAKAGAALVGGYTRTFASDTNRAALKHMIERSQIVNQPALNPKKPR